MWGPLVRILAQLIIVTANTGAKAFMAAYQQAARGTVFVVCVCAFLRAFLIPLCV